MWAAMSTERYTIGITGSRHGATPEQLDRAEILLHAAHMVHGARLLVVHGSCVGVDAQIDAFCARTGVEVVCRPSWLRRWTASVCAVQIAAPAAPRVRNRAIVRQSNLLIACPQGAEALHPRSGTWVTVRMARRHRVPCRIVWPDGVAEDDVGEDAGGGGGEW